MSVFLKFNRIRTNIRVGKKQIAYSVLFVFIFGVASGLIAKILDSTLIPYELSFLGFIGSNLGVWIFILTLVAAYSYTPKLAATRVFVFLISMLFSYYMYTNLILNLFPLKYIVFWFLAALLSIIPAYIMWFSRTDHLISSIITALPVSAIAFEGYKIYLFTVEYYEKFANVENVLVSDGVYFDMLGTVISYALMIIIILLFVPKRKKQSLYIIPFSVVIFSSLVAITL
ncbi:hypothetical protein [Bacillus sp. OK048]|uniref:hypothetical protein n=1 Tax=Bacillus sp. OK048 TaxID=1882761 RepID=UPI00088D73B4|nr:hypothetical protein [Bacillus sp. OK048]SDN87607.1 hypothetical protein SAMN05443253_12319 [Bacillus sp. OK048]